MKTSIAVLPALVFGTFGCASVKVDSSNALIAADRAFNADTQARRLAGWLAAFDVNGSQTDAEFHPITGAEAIRNNMQGFFDDPQNQLEWDPDQARISEAGNMGMTSGRFELRHLKSDGSIESVSRGRYFDVWLRKGDGAWKLLYDTGDFDTKSN